MNCLVCDNEFKQVVAIQKYCSKACYKIAKDKLAKERYERIKPERLKQIREYQKKNRKKRNKWMRGYSNKKYANDKNFRLKVKVRSLTVFRNKKDFCADCGSTENLEFHHFSYEPPVGKFIVLCKSCHRKADKVKKRLSLAAKKEGEHGSNT